ncbi:MAG: NAD-dependent epimerase/dehydratase family protein [Ornithinimicrobium sp.]|uniref:NAD-dependent epimerase/dehydratase family protein n=1 Tax=Ornithinimicrobium sp. TaxID=1977084 RepID=UPI003D9B855B
MSSHVGPTFPGTRVGAARVAVTRAASPVGQVLACELARAGDRMVGLDDRSGTAGDVDWRLTDIVSPSVVTALGDIDALVHLAYDADLARALAEPPAARRARLIREMQTLTTAAAAAGVAHLVVITSAMVFGAREDNPVPLPEDAARVADDAEGIVADLVEVEHLVAVARDVHPGLRVTSVRPAALVGPQVDTIISRHFEAPRLLTLRGRTPAWQFCHIEDLATAVSMVIRGELGDVVGVGADGSLTQQEVEEISGMRHVELAPAAAEGAAERLHRLGVIPVPATDLAYVCYPWVVSTDSLTARGWYPAYDNPTCLSILLETVSGRHAVMSRRVERRDAAIGAAGAASAAVAVAATAALMRRRRKR